MACHGVVGCVATVAFVLWSAAANRAQRNEFDLDRNNQKTIWLLP